MKKYSFFLFIVMIPNFFFSQNPCFEDCWETRNKLAANSEKSGADIFSINFKVLQDLVGCPIPEFDVETLKGEKLNSLDLQGRVVVLNFWFIYCAPCVAEMPGLNKLVKEFEQEEVVFLAFGRDDLEDVFKFLEKQEFDYQQIPNAEKWNDIFCTMGGFPMNMVIDKDGNLAYVSTGGDTDEPMEKYHELKPIIKKCL